MDKTIKPAIRAHSFVLFAALLCLLFAYIAPAPSAFANAMVGFILFITILVFKVKGRAYIFSNGVIKQKNWLGSNQTVKLAEIQKTKVKHRAMGTGDLILWTPSGKFKIQKISNPESLQDEITAMA